ncbi:MAG: hypothetical protein K0V04_45655 [Deltaproteobacteria bacterium]|nr:hypothetical protein [Deltaproteobacteria bacterium]
MRNRLEIFPLIVLGLSVIGCSPVLRSTTARGNSATYYTAEGGVVVRGGTRSKWSFCVMPPAQGVRQTTADTGTTIKAKAGSTVDVDLGTTFKTTHQTERLYEHDDATLFMQHGLYRICEIAQNGGFDRVEVYQNKVGKKKKLYVLEPEEYREMTKLVLKQTKDLIELKIERAKARQREAEAKMLELRSSPDQRRIAPPPPAANVVEPPENEPRASVHGGGSTEIGNG